MVWTGAHFYHKNSVTIKAEVNIFVFNLASRYEYVGENGKESSTWS
jgi:hypothetical protein